MLVALILGVGGILLVSANKPSETQQVNITNNIQPTITTAMKLTSSTFSHNQSIPSKYTCDGENVNPPLAIFDVPTNAKSLVLIMDDPDAPAGTWVHWTVWNIDPETKELAENSVPQGTIQGETSFGKSGYGGPCPPASTQRGEPSGTHRYFFKLYALDTTLSLTTSSTKQDLEKAMTGHILEQTELIGLYSRK